MSHQYSTRLPYISGDIVIPNSRTPKKVIADINSYIDKTNCEEFSVDISFMNVIDACYVSTMCSTEYFIKNPNGKINWFVSSDSVKEFSKGLSLGNCNYFQS